MVFDLGYYAHATFKQLREHGVSFVTRLNLQASYNVTATRETTEGKTPEGDSIVSDQTISLGSPNNRRGAVLDDMRLTTYRSQSGELCRLITDRADLTAVEVATLYRKRWRIELFFRWLKRVLGAMTPLGYSRAAVWLTILVAAIVAVLAYLSDAMRPKGVTRVSWLRALKASLIPCLRFSG